MRKSSTRTLAMIVGGFLAGTFTIYATWQYSGKPGKFSEHLPYGMIFSGTVLLGAFGAKSFAEHLEAKKGLSELTTDYENYFASSPVAGDFEGQFVEQPVIQQPAIAPTPPVSQKISFPATYTHNGNNEKVSVPHHVTHMNGARVEQADDVWDEPPKLEPPVLIRDKHVADAPPPTEPKSEEGKPVLSLEDKKTILLGYIKERIASPDVTQEEMEAMLEILKGTH